MAKIPTTLREQCPGVVDLPDKDLSTSEAARLWAADRSRLGECARRHGALSKALEQVEGQGR